MSKVSRAIALREQHNLRVRGKAETLCLRRIRQSRASMRSEADSCRCGQQLRSSLCKTAEVHDDDSAQYGRSVELGYGETVEKQSVSLRK